MLPIFMTGSLEFNMLFEELVLSVFLFCDLAIHSISWMCIVALPPCWNLSRHNCIRAYTHV